MFIHLKTIMGIVENIYVFIIVIIIYTEEKEKLKVKNYLIFKDLLQPPDLKYMHSN